MSEKRHALYRFFGEGGALLYIGITHDPTARWRQHQESKPWWHEVRGITVDHYPDRESVLAAERMAIAVEQPKYNKALLRRQPGSVRVVPGDRPARLEWTCGECGLPVDNGAGYIHVSNQEIYLYEEWQRAEDEKSRLNGLSFRAYSMVEMAQWPLPAQWQVHHRKCDPEPDQDDYWFDVDRARTQAHLLDWTSHLLEKCWIQSTNWGAFLRSAMQQNRQWVDA